MRDKTWSCKGGFWLLSFLKNGNVYKVWRVLPTYTYMHTYMLICAHHRSIHYTLLTVLGKLFSVQELGRLYIFFLDSYLIVLVRFLYCCDKTLTKLISWKKVYFTL